MLLAATMALGIGVVMVVTFLAHRQPWLGLELAPTKDGTGAVVRAATGPSAELPPGTIITAIANQAESIHLSSLDLTTEPDGAMGDYATYRQFLDRQDRLARIQASEEVILTVDDGRQFVIRPAAGGRPLADFPADFWVQCLVGLLAWFVSAAVFAFRPGEPSARYLLLSGASTLMFAPAAAVYTTRELAVPAGLLQCASDLNFFGGSLFAASFVGLLLVYPRRIAPPWAGPGVVVLFVLWFIAQQVGLFDSMTFARRFLVMVAVLTTFVLAALHWRLSGRDPLARAKLQWFLLSWVMGTSVFAFFILLPQAFGVDTSPIQGYAFLLFLLVYGGLAMGILRYRLFELGDWWRRVIAWAIVVLLLVVMDLFFLYGLHLSTGTSLAVALLICGVVWLPMRGWLWHRFAAQHEHYTPDLFQRVVDVALAPPEGKNQEARWRMIMDSVFQPLEISSDDSLQANQVDIQNDGLTLALAPVGRISGLRLQYARGGRGLFHPRDAALAGELVSMLKHAFEGLAAYQKGVAEERGRIARDMHDNIGAQLLGALHSSETAVKDARIRESLADLRAVINQKSDDADSMETTLAGLRIETAERLEAVGIKLKWTVPESDLPPTPAGVCHAVRSIIREAVSNAIRHAEAAEVTVNLEARNESLRLEVRDNGRGFDPAAPPSGNGLSNIRERLQALEGHFDLTSSDTGTGLKAAIPIKTPSLENEKLPDR